jgi:septum formation protein
VKFGTPHRRTLDAARDLLLEHSRPAPSTTLGQCTALAEDGEITWSSVDTVHTAMRPVSTQFVGRHLVAVATQAMGPPGACEIDRVGLQLLERTEGGYPAALGAPVFALFARLREIGFMAS